nr:hypothetical protein CFP56_48660 [Quercus suber]
MRRGMSSSGRIELQSTDGPQFALEGADWVGDYGFGKISKALSRINGCEVVVGPVVVGGGSLDGFDVGVGCSGLMD